ncbi:MAG TPA: hypothetical protein VLC92_15480 [Rhodocyclaceae bacterium]|nr:hypothetical protein [Rhodocyclaceae bacterium]
MNIRSSYVATAAVLLLASATAIASPVYTISTLNFVPWGINDAGQITGSYGSLGAVVQTGAVENIVGNFPGGTEATGLSINTSGHITGEGYTTQSINAPLHAFVWTGGALQDLGTLGGTYSSGRGINDAGIVVGVSSTAGDGAQHAFSWASGTMTDLGTLPGDGLSAAYGINNAGVIVGYSQKTFPDASHAVIWDGGTISDLGVGQAKAIDDSGRVAGVSNGNVTLWSAGVTHDLGSLGGGGAAIWDINNLGQIVGSTLVAGGSGRHAIISDGISLVDLNALIDPTLGWVLTDADVINDSGVIAGQGTFNGKDAWFLLTPGSEVPEPGTLTLVCAALLPFACRRIRFRKK